MNKLKVSVGVPAYNEGQNVKKLLESFVMQKGKKTEIKEIILVSDGSTDNTVNISQSVQDKRIKVIDRSKNMGKATRINEIFKIFKGDVLVLCDADMILKTNHVIEELCKRFLKDQRLGLIAGNPVPLKPETFIEKAINNHILARQSLMKVFNFGNTAFCAHGFIAYSKNFAKSLKIPSGIINDDTFTYFKCVTEGYRHSFSRNAVAYYRSPQNVREYLVQIKRYNVGGDQLCEHFGETIVNQEFTLPPKILLKLMFRQIVKNPVAYFYLKSLTIFDQLVCRIKPVEIRQNWELIKSSKRLT